MKKKVLDKRTIAAIRRRQYMMMLADNGGEEPEPQWNMRVVAHPTEGYSMPQTTGNFSLVEQRGDVYYYQHDGSDSTGNNVLSNSNYVVSDVTFKDCEHIHTIGWDFLPHLHSKTIDLSPFRNVTTIGGGFLNYSDFEYIDLSPLSSVVNVGQYRINYGKGFLAYSKSLKSIDITPLQGVKNIGERFLSDCESLVSVTLPTFNNLDNKTYSYYLHYFLYNCKSLVGDITINAPKLEKIGSDFLSDCAMVDSVTINAPNIKSIANGFLKGCGMINFDIAQLNDSVNVNGYNFMYGCKRLTSIDTSKFGAVNFSNGYSCFGGCKSLKNIDLSMFSNTTDIGMGLLSSCSVLQSVDLSRLGNVTTIGSGFLGWCRSLTSIDLSLLSNVTSVGDYFLYGCDGLQSVDRLPPNVTNIGSYFFSGCRFLTDVDLSQLSNVTIIGGYFFENCINLTSLKLPWTTIPTTSTTSFMSSVPSTCSIEVPCESVDTYKTTTPWSNRASYIVGDC